MFGNIMDITERQRTEGALRESEEKFSKAFHSNPAMLVLATLDGKNVDVNQAYADFLGYSREEILGKSVVDLQTVSVEERQKILELIQRGDGSVRNAEIAVQVRDGSLRHILLSVDVISLGSVPHRLTTLLDITERKQAEEALYRTNQSLTTIIQAAPLALITYDLNGIVKSWNPSAERIFGWKESEVLGRLAPHIGETYLSEFHALRQKVLQGGTQHSVEVDRQKKDGTPIKISLNTAPIYDQFGTMDGYMAIIEDITERKQAQDEIRRLKEFDENLINNMAEGIVVQNTNGYFTYVNPAVSAITGYLPEELVGKHWTKFIPADQHEIIKEADNRRPAGEASQYEIDFLHKSGNRINMLVSGSPLFENERFNGSMAVFTDITERKQAEEALRQSQASLENAEAQAHLGSWSFDPATQSGHWSKEMFHLFGRDPALGTPSLPEFMELIHPDDRGRLAAAQASILEGGESVSDDYRTNPERIPFRVLNAGFYSEKDGDGKVVRVLGTALDITERKHAEEEINYQARLLRHINDAVIATDDQFRITAWNRAAEAIYGWTIAEVMGRNVAEILSFGLTDQQRAAAKELLMEGSSSRSERIHSRKNGRPVYVEENTIALIDEQHRISGYVGVNRDISERKRAEEQILLQLQRLKALRAIDIAISSSFNLGLTLDILLDQVISQLKTDAAAVLLFNPVTKILEYAASRGFRSTAIHEAKVRLGEGYAGKAILERRTIHIPNLMQTDSELAQALLLKSEYFLDYYCVPLIVKGEVKGVLEIFHRSVLVGDPEWLDFLETLAGQAAIAVHEAALFENLQHSNRELFQAYDATIEGWSRALDLRDKETEGHTQRVTEMTLALARKYNFNDEELQNIRWGALLHDIGKMGVPDGILLKPDKLTEEEWVSMKKHPVFAFEMLSPIAYLKSAL
ncbi:MAG TPA: PAS domain S-box protein, partial [Anaerolineales bacterium]|nr:PAS domain S-box protein [Anaerolineales bacterium]